MDVLVIRRRHNAVELHCDSLQSILIFWKYQSRLWSIHI